MRAGVRHRSEPAAEGSYRNNQLTNVRLWQPDKRLPAFGAFRPPGISNYECIKVASILMI